MFDVFYSGPKPNLFEFERPADSLEHAAEQSRTRYYWYIYGGNDYTGFDFSWQPAPWESDHVHVFADQWQEDGRVYFANKKTAAQKNWNWRKEQQVKNRDVTDIYYVDHGNKPNCLEYLKLQYPNIKVTRFVHSYLDTFKRIANSAKAENIWIVSSLCNYSFFDFTWTPSQWQREMIHVFPSDLQDRGDTFYINVASFKKQMIELELLDWFNVINYCNDQRVERYEPPQYYYSSDDLVTEIKNYNFDFPYAVFTNQEGTTCTYYPCLWSAKDRTVTAFSDSGATCGVPREIKADLKTQVYDYPYLKKSQGLVLDQPLDIVYISNGEPDAEKWFERLRYSVFYHNAPFANRISRVQNVNGRAAAYRAAAEASTTPWFFAVFAKLEVNAGFDWDWQPDYWQEPKHYIFHARNPVNGLEYGHQAMIAYNKRLVLETTESGLDFTLSKAHEVVPIVSGTAHFNQSPWMTWRTAFREVLKLKQFNDAQPTIENEHRLKTWLTKAQGAHAKWSLKGAADAVEYYDSVNGNYDKLMLSFEWDWLRDYFSCRYSTS